jgi:hypothetical protein
VFKILLGLRLGIVSKSSSLVILYDSLELVGGVGISKWRM